jgi:hypothetical protein
MCFETGSSLSHFEDMCPIPSTNNLGCATSTNLAANNNKYYVMSNAGGMGTCYVKRFLKEEERYVLCDIGYTVASVFGSTVAGSNYTYSGACSGPGVWGMNDGIANGSYVYTAALSVTAQIAVPIPTVLMNDSPNTVSLSCLEIIQNTTNITASISGTNIIITNTASASGPVILKYLPQDNGSNFGGPTYIFAYFYSANCPNVNPCELVQNGGFEAASTSTPCGNMQTAANVNCWSTAANYPGYFLRNCTSDGGGYNLGTNTWGLTTPAVDSYSGSPNNAIIGIQTFVSSSMTGYIVDVLESQLSGPLSPSVTYQISMWAFNPSTVIPSSSYGPNAIAPVVISIESMPNLGFIGFPSPMASFTINPTGSWTSLTNTFVFTPTVAHSAIRVSISPTTALIANLSPTVYQVYSSFIDEISITPIPAPSFQIPNATSCGNTTFTNLAQYASVTGTFIGTGVTLNGTQYDFNVTGTLSPGSYPIGFSYTTASCTNTLWQSIVVSPGVTLSVAGTATACAFSTSPVTLTASSSCTACSGNSYYWQPGYIMGSTATFTPAINSIFTVNVISGSCIASQTFIPISLSPTCCASTLIPTFTGTSVSSFTSLAGPLRIANSFTVQSGAICVLGNGEFIMDVSTNTIQIVVEPGGRLEILGAHLFSCGSTLWKGILVKDGGRVLTMAYGGRDCLIEDAEIAINVPVHFSSSVTPIGLNNTILNKNYIDINLYSLVLNSIPITINECVFSCRDFTFTSYDWPNGSTSASGLRAASNPTNPLSTPFSMQNFPVTNLKSPYTTRRSYVAINLNYGGVTSGGTSPPQMAFYHVTLTPQNAFTLFDSHEYFVKSVNSNLRMSNSVFQNTQTFSVSGTQTVGAAIDFSCSTLTTYTPNANIHNFELDLTASSLPTGNRFYDCHRAITGNNPFSFKINNATFKSTHLASTVTNTAIISTGLTGVFMSTNQMEDYIVQNNVFNNISDGVVISLYPNNVMKPGFSYTAGTPQTFMVNAYIHTLTISNNTFSPENGIGFTGTTSGYVKNAISVSSANYAMTTANYSAGIHIEDNEIYRVLNGIIMNAVNPVSLVGTNAGAQKLIRRNRITLEEDNIFGGIPQRAIEYVNNLSEPVFNGQRLQVVEDNTLTVFGPASVQSNPNISLYYGSYNGGTGTLFPTPHILCNYVSNANRGFEFEQWNKPASWRGNEMEDLQIGMLLNNSGVIGAQGNSVSPIDNEWNGSGWSGTNYGIYTYSSNAGQSPIYTRSISPFNPPNLDGLPTASSYTNIGKFFAGSGSYTCGASGYSLMNSAVPSSTSYPTEEQYYIAKIFAYRHLALDEDTRSADSEMNVFYEDLAETTIDLFMQVDTKISECKFVEAEEILDGMSTEGYNEIETNYHHYYSLAIRHYSKDYEFTSSDLGSLKTLAALCPGTNGSVIHQARALYQLITGFVYNGPNDCTESEGKIGRPRNDEEIEKVVWNVDIYPNPTSGNLTVKSNEKVALEIIITDIAGRFILSEKRPPAQLVDLKLSLPNGAYFMTVIKQDGSSIKKILLIAK